MKKYMEKIKLLETGIFILLAISNILMVLNSFMNIEMTNAVIEGNYRGFFRYLSIVIIMMISVSVVQYLCGVLQAKSKKYSALKLREKYFNNYVENYCLSQKNIADIGVSRLTNDVSYIIQHRVDANYRFWNLVMGVVFPLVGVTLIHWSFLIVFPVSAMLSFLAMQKISPILQQISSEQSVENERFVAHISDLMGGFSTVFSFQALGGFLEKVKTVSLSLEEKKEVYGRKFAFAQSIIMCTMVLSQLVYIIVAGLLVISGKTTAGAIVGLMSIASAFYGNCQNLLSIKMEMDSAKPLCDKLLKTEVAVPKDTVSLSDVKEKIEVRQLSFGYPDTDKKIFDGASFSFEIGEKYLIKGKSGSGKSTLMKLISGRLTDYQGEILYDGVDIQKLTAQCFTELIAYIDQNTHIFEETIKNNITFGKPVDAHSYQNAIKQAGLEEYIANLPQKDDFLLHKGGTNLSGGQKQRIAIARGILYGKKIFILDEGFQGLDQETANAIEDEILAMDDCTVFVISHSEEAKKKSGYTRLIEVAE